ncbi:hypothetical protein [Oceanibaculum pacificum]|uniref:Uncharacterized protein n=1 Tax=Oceanibaculum pacificum TaxID=580166 RepID=A0A154W8D2_9PROT|nr:hypothetical protein [Oceanibaculum pacificum]KZD09780.1 hypothetical protein AUP43_00940 [Oceanibaculum pacificum]
MSSECDDHIRAAETSGDCFAGLDAGRKLALWGMRVWVAGLRQEWPPARTREALLEGFALTYATEALGPLEAMMSVLAGGAARQIAMNCPRCPSVTEDEHLLLDLLALCQARGVADRLDPFAKQAASLLTPSGVRLFEAPALLFSTSLAAAGMVLPARRAGQSEAGATILRFVHPAPAHLQ